MTIGIYRKKPIQIEAVQFTGHNDAEIAAFVGEYGYDPETFGPSWEIMTLHGEVTAYPGDWIIRGHKGDYWPCENTIFVDSYEPIGEIIDDRGRSQETCVRCGWTMGDPPINCQNDDTPHVFPSQAINPELEGCGA